MSIGHRLPADELSDATVEELYSALGERDTPKLFALPFKVDTDHDIPMGGGNSVDRKTVYVDRTLYQEVMDGAFKKTELTPRQIVDRWLDHEHTELVIEQGDNNIDVYQPAHNRALRKEHEGVLDILPPRSPAEAKEIIARYEETTWPALMRCYQRDVKKPPVDLWCGPHLDDPTPRDEELLEQMRRLGVFDARKRSRYDVHYGVGPKYCRDCTMFKPQVLSQEHKQLAICEAVSGLVRDTRWCELFVPRNSA